MKSFTSSVALAAIVALTGAVSAKAAVATPGNLVIGFRAETGTTGENSNVVIDLGASTSISSSTRNTYDFSGAGSILSSTYGANWWSRTDLYYGVISYNGYEILDGADYYQDLWSTRLNNSGSVFPEPANVYNANPVFQAFALNTPETALASGDVTGTTRTGGSITGQYLTLDNAEPNSWASSSLGGWGGIFAESQDNLVSSFTSSANALGVYRTYGGLFDFQQSIQAAVYIDAGSLVVVPEPSTYMLLGVSAATLFLAVRRRKTA